MKSHFGKLVLVLAVAAVAGFAGAQIGGTRKVEQQTAMPKESVYDRIMRTRTIRCGYFVHPPFLSKEANSGKLTGLYVDFMEALASIVGLKIEWASELNFSTFVQDIATGKFDMECAGGWANAKRGQFVFYPQPYAYIPLVAIVRDKDTRFDLDPNSLNDPQVKIATIDGESGSVVGRLRFGASKDISMPQNSSYNDLILSVITGKADATLVDFFTAVQFREANAGSIKIIKHTPPLFMVAISPTLPPDIRLKQMVDVATYQLLNTGVVEQLLRKYETEPGQFLRVALPFRN